MGRKIKTIAVFVGIVSGFLTIGAAYHFLKEAECSSEVVQNLPLLLGVLQGFLAYGLVMLLYHFFRRIKTGLIRKKTLNQKLTENNK